MEKGTDVIAVHIFKVGLVNGACLTMFINGWNFLVQIYYIPTFYQLVYGYSAKKSAVLLLPITLTQSEEHRKPIFAAADISQPSAVLSAALS